MGFHRRVRHPVRSLITAVSLLAAAALAAAPAGAAQLLAGASEVDITPDRPVALEVAFALRVSQGVDSPIRASVLFLESREGDRVLDRAVAVGADLVHLPADLLEMVREATSRRLPDLDTPSRIGVAASPALSAALLVALGRRSAPQERLPRAPRWRPKCLGDASTSIPKLSWADDHTDS